MLFNSFQFLIFFFFVSLIYFFVKHRYRWVLLLVVSYYFYMCWKPEYLILVLISTLIDYVVGIQIGRTEDRAHKKRYLFLSITANLCLLFTFKYFNFFNGALKNIFMRNNLSYGIPQLDILLPVGISFYTFQTLSYTFDVYMGRCKPEKHLGIFSLYVVFFPQLVAGPIERSVKLLPQFFKKINFDYKRIIEGLILMLWGFFQKVVIADRLALIVDSIYSKPGDHNGVILLFATYAFAFQIYCDFSGYTDIARGSAQVLGYNLMSNFARPYFAGSIRDFWRRWHISLTSWFKDYVYIPMGGNRVIRWRWYFNVITVFLLCGLWHGAAWTFIFWGLLHSIYFLISFLTKRTRAKIVVFFHLDKVPFIHKIIKILITFHLVLISWVFFRAQSISQACYMIKQMFYDVAAVFISVKRAIVLEDVNRFIFSDKGLFIAIAGIIILLFVHILERKQDFRSILASRAGWLRWTVYLFLVLSIMNLGVAEEIPFIYFQF